MIISPQSFWRLVVYAGMVNLVIGFGMNPSKDVPVCFGSDYILVDVQILWDNCFHICDRVIYAWIDFKDSSHEGRHT